MQELPFLNSERCPMFIDICMKFHEDSLRGFQVKELTQSVTDKWTDTWAKTIYLPTLMGEDINIQKKERKKFEIKYSGSRHFGNRLSSTTPGGHSWSHLLYLSCQQTTWDAMYSVLVVFYLSLL